MGTQTNIKRALACSVPYRMRDLAEQGGPKKEDWDEAIRFLQWFASEKVIHEFRVPTLVVGRTPELFDQLSQSLAVCAWLADGIMFLGQHWRQGKTALPPATEPLPDHYVGYSDDVCRQCGKCYRDHFAPPWWIDTRRARIFRRLCDGSLVRLNDGKKPSP